MRKQRAERLRFAVNTLPPETQRAMLRGIEQNRIVTGANTDRRGGVCPMLAADRNAFTVTPLAGIFATAWDHYTGTSFVNVNRRAANDRDLKVLRSMLETSLELSSGAATDLALGVSEMHTEAAPSSSALARPDLAETSRALTAAAKLEVIRALEATGHAARRPVLRAEPAPASRRPTPDQPAPALAPRVEAAPGAAPRVEAVPAPRPTPVRPAPALAPTARIEAVPVSATNKTKAELERERARAILANQASTLRRQAWPRAAAPAPAHASAVPAPAAAPAPTLLPAAPSPELGDRDRTRELQERSGWAWLRPFSSYEDYERTLHDLGEMDRAPRADDGGHRRRDAESREPTPA